MRILLDHCTPALLGDELSDHEVATAWQKGWDTLSNGALLSRAEQHHYDLLFTTDRDFRDRSGLASRTVSVLLLVPNRWRFIRQHLGEIRDVVARISPGGFEELRCW